MALDINRTFDFAALEDLKSKYNTVLDAADTITTDMQAHLQTISNLYASTPNNVREGSLVSSKPTIASPTYLDAATTFQGLIDKLVSEIPRYDSSAATALLSLKELTTQLVSLIGRYDDLIEAGFRQGDVKDFQEALNDIKSEYKDTLDLISSTTEMVREASKGLAVASTVYSIDPINMATGNFSCEKRDIVVDGASPIELIRTYNAIDTYSGRLGYNWVHNFETRLFIEQDFIKIQLHDGRIHKYTWDDNKNCYLCAIHPGGLLRKFDNQFEYSDEGALYRFDEAGFLIEIIDVYSESYHLEYHNGLLVHVESVSGRLNFTYDLQGRLIKVDDGVDQVVEYQYFRDLLASSTKNGFIDAMYRYDASGEKLSAITNVLNNVIIENIYDDSFRVVRQNFPDGGCMLYQYEDKEKLVILTERNGSKIIYRHDDKFRIDRITYEDGVESFFYDAYDRKTMQIDKNNNVTKYSYDKYGNITRVCNALDQVTEMICDEDGHPLTVIWPNGARFELDYNASGNLIGLKNPMGHKYELVYDSKQNVTELIAPDGGVVSFTYDERKNMIAYRMPDGAETKYWYNADNKVVKTQDANGNKTEFAYTTNGKIAEIKNPYGACRKFFYGQNGLLEKIADFDGSQQSFVYNKLGKRSQIVHQDGTSTNFEYDIMWNLSQVTEANGAITQFTYDKLNRLKAIENANRHQTIFQYDKNDNLTECRTGKGNTTKYAYDQLNNIRKIIYPDGGEYDFTFNEIGKLVKKVNPLGQETFYEYNPLGQLICETDHLGNQTKYTYTPLGNVASITDSQNGTTLYSYYLGGSLKSVTLPEGETLSYKYDLNGNLVEKSENQSKTTRFIYDKLDRLVEIVDPLLNVESYSYDAMGRVTEFCDPNGNITHYRYSVRGHLIGITDPMGNVTSYDYDNVGNLSAITLTEMFPKNYQEASKINNISKSFTRIRYEYDLMGNTIKGIAADGSVTSYTYDEENHIVGKTDPDGRHTKVDYTYWGSISTVNYDDGRTVELQYDSLRNLTQIQDWLGTVSMTYNAQNMIQDTVFPNGEKISYAWDSLGRKSRMEYPDGTLALFEYDKLGRLVQSTVNDDSTIFQYDSHGNLVRKDMPGAVTAQYKYDVAGQLTEFMCADASEMLEHYRYRYDKCGNILQTEKQRKNVAEDSGIFDFGYDKLHRISDIMHNGRQVRSYTYDGFGNRTRLLADNTTTEYQYNELQQLIAQKTPNNNIQYRYDKSGNQTQEFVNGLLNKEMHFDAANQLSKIIKSNGDELQFQYSGTMQRMGYTYKSPDKPLQEVQYLLDFTNTVDNLLQKSVNGSTKSYVHASDFLATPDMQYITDPFGSPLRVLDQNGDTISVMAYNEFGTKTVDTSERRDVFGFTGYEDDYESGMLYAKARYYSPDTGRFISQDPIMGALLIPQAFNAYTYVTNRPTRYTDKSGMFLNILIGAVVGAVVNVASTVVVSVVTGQGLPSGEELLGAAVGGAVGGAVMGALAPFSFTPLGSGIVGGITSGVSTLTTKIAENVTGKASHSVEDIFWDTAISTGIGFGVGWLVGAAGNKLASSVGHQVGIPGINAGTNSFGAVFKSGMTKLVTGTAGRMGLKVIGKGIIYMFVDGLLSDFAEEGVNKLSDYLRGLVDQMQQAKTPEGKYEVLFGESVNPAFLCII